MKRNPVVPSLYAPNLPETIAYYVETLGFTRSGHYDDGGSTIWAELTLGDAKLWFYSRPIADRGTPAMSGLVYIFVDDVDTVAERLRGRVAVRWGPETQDYGLRELGLEDLNGYLLVFAQDV